MRGSPERKEETALIRRWRAVAAAAILCVARPSFAGDISGALTADRSRVGEGGTVCLALTVTAPGNARGCRPARPVLPPLRLFDLVSTSQRNEVAFGAAGETYSTTFLYVLRAKSAGEEAIPAIGVRGVKGEKGEGETLLTAPGLKLVVDPASRGLFRWGLAVAAVAVAAGTALAVSYIARRRGRPSARPVERRAATARPDDAALAALAAMEDARPLRLSGDWGAYAARIHGALADCAARGGDPELAEIAGVLGALGERVRYARDVEAERAIGESVRKAELILKRKIREG